MADLVDHKQKVEILTLGINVFLNFPDQLLNGHVSGFSAVEPVTGGGFAHSQHFNQRINHIVLKEGEGIPGIFPAVPVNLLKLGFECIQLPRLFDELLQLSHF